MRRVILESPYAAGSGLRGLIGRWLNRRYARRALRDSLARGEAPIASHLLYTQRGVLRDHRADERQWGIDAGLAWRSVAEASVVYNVLVRGGFGDNHFRVLAAGLELPATARDPS